MTVRKLTPAEFDRLNGQPSAETVFPTRKLRRVLDDMLTSLAAGQGKGVYDYILARHMPRIKGAINEYVSSNQAIEAAVKEECQKRVDKLLAEIEGVFKTKYGWEYGGRAMLPSEWESLKAKYQGGKESEK